jgi:hypothetical protein
MSHSAWLWRRTLWGLGESKIMLLKCGFKRNGRTGFVQSTLFIQLGSYDGNQGEVVVNVWFICDKMETRGL